MSILARRLERLEQAIRAGGSKAVCLFRVVDVGGLDNEIVEIELTDSTKLYRGEGECEEDFVQRAAGWQFELIANDPEAHVGFMIGETNPSLAQLRGM